MPRPVPLRTMPPLPRHPSTCPLSPCPQIGEQIATQRRLAECPWSVGTPEERRAMRCICQGQARRYALDQAVAHDRHGH